MTDDPRMRDTIEVDTDSAPGALQLQDRAAPAALRSFDAERNTPRPGVQGKLHGNLPLVDHFEQGGKLSGGDKPARTFGNDATDLHHSTSRDRPSRP
jgi:hypothetical protein